LSIRQLIGAHGLVRFDEIALHMLDLARNSVESGARNVTIQLVEESATDRLMIEVCDDGPGMPDAERLRIEAGERPHDRPGGAGLTLLAEAARAAGGSLEIDSRPRLGTTVRAIFRYHDPRRPPVGDLEWTLMVLIAGHPGANITFRHTVDGRMIEIQSHDLDRGGNRSAADVLTLLRSRIRHGEASLCATDHEPAWR
jgi:hypothetical protein